MDIGKIAWSRRARCDVRCVPEGDVAGPRTVNGTDKIGQQRARRGAPEPIPCRENQCAHTEDVSGISASAPQATTVTLGCCIATSTCVMRMPSLSKKTPSEKEPGKTVAQWQPGARLETSRRGKARLPPRLRGGDGAGRSHRKTMGLRLREDDGDPVRCRMLHDTSSTGEPLKKEPRLSPGLISHLNAASNSDTGHRLPESGVAARRYGVRVAFMLTPEKLLYASTPM